MKIIPICCGMVTLICLFVAYEQYQSNAASVQFMNNMGGGMMNSMIGGVEMQPATPTSTKYALFFGFISAVAGFFFYHKNDAAKRSV